MTTPDALGFALVVEERLARLDDLLTRSPESAVGVFDPSRNLRDTATALAEVDLALGDHVALTSGALVDFVATGDVGLLSDASIEASVEGIAMRTVRLRDGRTADLHLIEISDTTSTTVVVLVPGVGETITSTPPPTAVPASPRIGFVLCDAFGVITTASPSSLALLRSHDAIEGSQAMNLIHPDDREMAAVNWSAAKEQRAVSLRWRCRLVRADGSPLWVEITITNEITDDGTGSVRFDLYDISAEVAATEALVAERELIALLTETLPVGVAKFDADGEVEHANARLEELLAPLDLDTLLAQAMEGDLEDLDLAAAFSALRHDGATSRVVVRHTGPDGAARHLEWTIRAARAEVGTITGGVLCVADVTEAAQLRDTLETRSITDALTGCLNRAGTTSALDAALADVAADEGIALLFIDLDGFKHVNDSRGHAVGDAVLVVVATRLRSAVRPGDLVGRLGGDEFVVIAPGLVSVHEALAFAARIARQVCGPAMIGRAEVPVAASIGVAWTVGTTADALLDAADGAMYVAKQRASDEPVAAPMPLPR